MLKIEDSALVFTFPEHHPDAELRVSFQRTLRIPDDGRTYPLPPGLGEFPLRLVDDFPARVPQRWLENGGVLLSMYQSEAMWMNFSSSFIPERGTGYPFALKIAAGKINAVTGDDWAPALGEQPQDYVSIPGQPWLDGFCVEKGSIRQFVAMPLGTGYSAEEQITGRAEHGGVQLIAYPMKKEIFEKKFPVLPPGSRNMFPGGITLGSMDLDMLAAPADGEMGLAPGGKMTQDIYEDANSIADYDATNHRCFMHIANSLIWRSITGDNPPTVPFTAREYNNARLPWFEYYDDSRHALAGAERLAGLKSVVEMGKEKGDEPLPENESLTPDKILQIRKRMEPGEVREGRF